MRMDFIRKRQKQLGNRWEKVCTNYRGGLEESW